MTNVCDDNHTGSAFRNFGHFTGMGYRHLLGNTRQVRIVKWLIYKHFDNITACLSRFSQWPHYKICAIYGSSMVVIYFIVKNLETSNMITILPVK